MSNVVKFAPAYRRAARDALLKLRASQTQLIPRFDIIGDEEVVIVEGVLPRRLAVEFAGMVRANQRNVIDIKTRRPLANAQWGKLTIVKRKGSFVEVDGLVPATMARRFQSMFDLCVAC